MHEIDTLIQGRWIVPVEPEGTTLEDHCLAVHEGRILEVLPAPAAQEKYLARTVNRLDSHVLTPGFINAHTHAAMSLMRGLADDLPLMEWLNQHIWPVESRCVNDEFVHDGVQLAIAEMLRGGTTCFNDMYFFPEVTARTADMAGIRACVGLIVIDFPTPWASTPDEYLAKGLAVHDRFRGNPLVHSMFAPHAPYSVSDDSLERIRILSDELEIGIHIHLHETADEVQQAVEKNGMRPLERLRRLGLLSPSLLAVHMTRLQEEEIRLFADAGACIVHCPESNLKLASGFCEVRRLEDAGITIALGTDGAASNNDQDMLGEARTAALLGKAIAGDASALPAHRVLRMATLHGAKALGIADMTGSLEPGKWADITAIGLDHIETQPLYDPVSQLIYASGRDKVTDVWVAGQHLLKERTLTTLDKDEILSRARGWQTRIRHSEDGT